MVWAPEVFHVEIWIRQLQPGIPLHIKISGWNFVQTNTLVNRQNQRSGWWVWAYITSFQNYRFSLRHFYFDKCSEATFSSRKQIQSFSNVQQQQSTKVAHRTLKNGWREKVGRWTKHLIRNWKEPSTLYMQLLEFSSWENI